MPGFRSNPFAYMARAEAFALSAVWEGFGSVVIEAMACGTPVVSIDCPSGPGEIITDRVDGLLVPPADPTRLAAALERVLVDRALASRMSQAGRLRAQAFAPSVIVRQYEETLSEVGYAPW